jgi:hypothetical protein
MAAPTTVLAAPIVTPPAQRSAPARTVFCLNCGRTLALLDEREDGHHLRPRAGATKVALRRTPRGLRCAACGGFPYIED